MNTRLLRVAALALSTALAACAAPAASPRLAAAQAPGAQLHVGTVAPVPVCAVDDGSSFNTPEAVKLPKNAFGCVPQ
jgi:hypothetical protein